MINTYNKERFWDGGIFKTVEEYSDKTLKANTPEKVKMYIEEYLEKNTCSVDVYILLNEVLSNHNLLQRTQVCFDGSYRNCVILVRPDGWTYTGYHTLPWNDIKSEVDILKFFDENAEIFFLNMTDETWADIEEWDRMMDNELDYYSEGYSDDYQ
jgi:hypothetical protein